MSNLINISKVPQVLPARDHYTLLACNVIWLISRTGFEQPTHSWYHKVAFKGGYTVGFDLDKNTWLDSAPFSPLDDSEDTEEVVFEYQGRIVLLLYSNYGQVAFRQLAVFDTNERQFTMWDEFPAHTTLNATEKGTRHEVIVADGVLPTGEKVLITVVNDEINILKLNIDFELRKATIEKTASYPVSFGLFPINAATQGPFVIVEYSNRNMCAVMWERHYQDRLLIEQAAETTNRVDIKSADGEPAFAIGGGRLLSLVNNRSWLHIAGNRLHGLHNAKFVGDAWVLDFPFSNEPQWKRVEDFEIPEDMADAHLAFDRANQTLYLLELSKGVFRTKVILPS